MAAAQEVIDFFSDGSSGPDLARQELAHANAYGYDAMWVILRIDGEIVGRLDDKIAPYRLKPGRVSWQARQIDGPGMVSTRSVGPEGYGDRGFQAGGVVPDGRLLGSDVHTRRPGRPSLRAASAVTG